MRQLPRLPSFDEQQSGWVYRQVEYVKSQVYEYEFSELKARELIPTSFEESDHATFVTYYIYNKVGMFSIVSRNARTLPRVDMYAEEVTVEVKTLGGSYGWSTADVRAAIANNTNLNARDARVAREAHLQRENRIAWFGDRRHRLAGMIEHPNSIRVILPADGQGGASSLASKRANPANMIRDLGTIAKASMVVTDGVERPDTMLLNMEDYIACSETQYGDNDTVLTFFLRNNPFISMIDWVPDLAGGGSNGEDAILCYKRDPMKLELVIPLEFTQLMPQEVGLEIEVNCEATCAGIVLYKPLSLAYALVSRRGNAQGPQPQPNPDN